MRKYLTLLQFFMIVYVFLPQKQMLSNGVNRGEVLAKNIPTWSKLAIDNIRGKTKVPILVPTIKIVNYTEVIAKSEADKQSYSIYYGGKDVPCIISTCGTFGRAGGELIVSDTIDYAKKYKDLVFSPEELHGEEGGYIKLSRNVMGFYIPRFCFLYCNGGSIVWRQGKYQYFVSYRLGGSLKELVIFANSAIDNQL